MAKTETEFTTPFNNDDTHVDDDDNDSRWANRKGDFLPITNTSATTENEFDYFLRYMQIGS